MTLDRILVEAMTLCGDCPPTPGQLVSGAFTSLIHQLHHVPECFQLRDLYQAWRQSELCLPLLPAATARSRTYLSLFHPSWCRIQTQCMGAGSDCVLHWQAGSICQMVGCPWWWELGKIHLNLHPSVLDHRASFSRLALSVHHCQVPFRCLARGPHRVRHLYSTSHHPQTAQLYIWLGPSSLNLSAACCICLAVRLGSLSTIKLENVLPLLISFSPVLWRPDIWPTKFSLSAIALWSKTLSRIKFYAGRHCWKSVTCHRSKCHSETNRWADVNCGSNIISHTPTSLINIFSSHVCFLSKGQLYCRCYLSLAAALCLSHSLSLSLCLSTSSLSFPSFCFDIKTLAFPFWLIN